MASITEIKNRLPNDFVEEIYSYFSDGTVDNILRGISSKRNTTIRVNTLKYNIYDLMQYFKEINIKFERVLWYKDALIIKNANEQELQKLDIYKKGYIYLQSLSSMIPPLVLSPKPYERILDVASAPGSKTTQIACLMENKGEIIANELDKLRFERLKYNVEAQGASIVKLENGRGEALGKKYVEEFDKVLLDTPCSGEGRFSSLDPRSYRSWSKKEVLRLSKLQKKLINSACVALKHGGILVYSTCTINEYENEDIVSFAINELGLKLEEINIDIKDSIKGITEETKKCIRILPSKDMEGFFVAKFRKL